MRALLEKFIDKHPLTTVVIVVILLTLVVIWLQQPVEIIYDPDAPPLNCRWNQDC